MGALRDVASGLAPVASIVPAVQSATATGTGVDIRGYDSAAVLINTGAIVSSGNFTPTLEESDDDSSYSAVAAADLEGVFPSALAASSAYVVGYVGDKRYIRCVLTKNSGTSIAAGAVILKGHGHQAPEDHDYSA